MAEQGQGEPGAFENFLKITKSRSPKDKLPFAFALACFFMAEVKTEYVDGGYGVRLDAVEPIALYAWRKGCVLGIERPSLVPTLYKQIHGSASKQVILAVEKWIARRISAEGKRLGSSSFLDPEASAKAAKEGITHFDSTELAWELTKFFLYGCLAGARHPELLRQTLSTALEWHRFTWGTIKKAPLPLPKGLESYSPPGFAAFAENMLELLRQYESVYGRP